MFSEGLDGQYVDHKAKWGLGLLQGEDTNVLTLDLTGTLHGGQFGGGVLRGSQVYGGSVSLQEVCAQVKALRL